MIMSLKKGHNYDSLEYVF